MGSCYAMNALVTVNCFSVRDFIPLSWQVGSNSNFEDPTLRSKVNNNSNIYYLFTKIVNNLIIYNIRGSVASSSTSLRIIVPSPNQEGNDNQLCRHILQTSCFSKLQMFITVLHVALFFVVFPEFKTCMLFSIHLSWNMHCSRSFDYWIKSQKLFYASWF